MNFENLNKEIKSCEMCEGLNSKELGTQNAPGYGNMNSKLMIIGQSLCGKPCIESQIPFTGGSGKILDQAFEKTNTSKSNFYTTNIVKCHPPENRESKKHEIENCSPYLEQELNLIRPKEIICLGKVAWSYFNEKIKCPGTRKVKRNDDEVTIHYLYHPAFIVKQPKIIRENYVHLLTLIIESNNA